MLFSHYRVHSSTLMRTIRKIYNWLPFVPRWIAYSRKLVLPGFQGVPFYDVVRFFLLQINRVGLNERAAAISFHFIMAIPPACIFLFTLVPYFPIATQFNEEVMQLVKDLTPNVKTQQLVQDFLNDYLKRPRGKLLSAGLIFALYFASNAVMGIINSFNRSIQRSTPKNHLEERWRAIKLTFIIMLLFIASMLILITQGALFEWLMQVLAINSPWIQWLILTLRWVVIVGLFFYSIAFIYRHAPSVDKKWKLISPGSITACTLMIAFVFLFSYWVNNIASYDKIYGSIGTIMVIMVLIYINSMVLLIGFELNLSVHSQRAESDKWTAGQISGSV